MKKLLTISVLFSLVLAAAANAETVYNSENSMQNNTQSNYNAKIESNRDAWNQTIHSYNVNYNDSMRKYWDQYTEAYQKQKRIQH